MPPPPRMSAEARKESILAAAVPLFAKHGFKGTTTKMIAKAAGISEALLYRHFPSKEAIYGDLKHYCSDDKKLLSEKMGSLEPGTQTLVGIIVYMIHHIVMGDPLHNPERIDHRDMHRLMANSYLEDGAFARAFIAESVRIWEPVLRPCVDAAIASGDLIDPWINTANRWWFAHHLAVGMGFIRLPEEPVIPYEVDLRTRLDQAIRFCLRGMGLTDNAIETYYNPVMHNLFTDVRGRFDGTEKNSQNS